MALSEAERISENGQREAPLGHVACGRSFAGSKHSFQGEVFPLCRPQGRLVAVYDTWARPCAGLVKARDECVPWSDLVCSVAHEHERCPCACHDHCGQSALAPPHQAQSGVPRNSSTHTLFHTRVLSRDVSRTTGWTRHECLLVQNLWVILRVCVCSSNTVNTKLCQSLWLSHA